MTTPAITQIKNPADLSTKTEGNFYKNHKLAIRVGIVAIAAITVLALLLFIPGAPLAGLGITIVKTFGTDTIGYFALGVIPGLGTALSTVGIAANYINKQTFEIPSITKKTSFSSDQVLYGECPRTFCRCSKTPPTLLPPSPTPRNGPSSSDGVSQTSPTRTKDSSDRDEVSPTSYTKPKLDVFEIFKNKFF